MVQLQDKRDNTTLFRLSGVKLAWCILPFPIFAFLACVIISVVFHFEGSTYTHCQVVNYLPSISAAIGGFTPQRYIWRVCIALHSAPRFMIACIYYNYFKSYPVSYKPAAYNFLCGLASLLHILENLALVLLTYVSSTENYEIHEKSFIAFVACSQLYMLIQCILHKWAHSKKAWTSKEWRSYQLKKWLFIFNVSCLLGAVYFFIRHNQHCEPYVYTIFAICEYCIVLSNVAFHGTATLDIGQGGLEFVNPVVKVA